MRQGISAKVYQAKKTLADAEKSRATLHMVWHQHLSDSVARWKDYAAEFAEQDGVLKQQVDAANDHLRQVRKEWEESKEADVQEISDAEESKDAMDTGSTITEGLTVMVQQLEAVKAKSDAQLIEPPAKRARGDSSVGKLGSGALEPFGKAKS